VAVAAAYLGTSLIRSTNEASLNLSRRFKISVREDEDGKRRSRKCNGYFVLSPHTLEDLVHAMGSGYMERSEDLARSSATVTSPWTASLLSKVHAIDFQCPVEYYHFQLMALRGTRSKLHR